MKDETYEQLFDIAAKRKDFVTPLIIDYYQLESLGIKEEGILDLIKNKYNPSLS